MIRLVPVVLLIVVVAAGFGANSSASPQGTCRMHMTGTSDELSNRYAQTLDTVLPDGSIVVGSAYGQGHSVIVHLRRVLPGCRIAAAFGAVLGRKFGSINTIAATPDGRILLGGSEGHRALVGRFFANGGLDRSFGIGGWTRFGPHTYRSAIPLYFTATSIAVGPDGTIVVGGTDNGGHCCIRSFVSELTPNGAPIATFGRGGSMVIPRYAGSDTARVFPQPDRSVYVLDQYEQSDCGSPNVVRIFTDGSLDSRFDKRIGRTIRRLTRPGFRFVPGLVPDGSGGFTFVGGLDRTCTLTRRRPTTGGVSVRVGSSGLIVGGLTYFRSPGFAFDSPAAIRLPSGRIVAAGAQYPRSYRAPVRHLVVQVFGPDGSRDPDIGIHGQLRFATPRRVRTDSPTVDLLPAAGNLWLAAGLPHEIDLTPIPVR